MKLTDFSPHHVTVEGAKVAIYVELDDPLPANVALELEVHYQQADGQPAQKKLTRTVPCERLTTDLATAQVMYRFRLTWEVKLKEDAELREQLAKITFTLPNIAVKAMSPKTIAVVGIEITNSTVCGGSCCTSSRLRAASIRPRSSAIWRT